MTERTCGHDAWIVGCPECESEYRRATSQIEAGYRGVELENGDWHELGSDARMSRVILQRVRSEGVAADRARQRKIQRRGE